MRKILWNNYNNITTTCSHTIKVVPLHATNQLCNRQ